MNDEQRKSKRVPADVRVYFGSRSADHLGFVQDISEEGMRIRARKAFPKDTALQLNVEVPGLGMVPAKGVVKRARKVLPPLPPNEPVEMGVVITEGSKVFREMILKLIAVFKEKRAGWRKEIQLSAVLGDAQRLLEEYTQNIGEGGLFVVTENPPKAEEKVAARVILPAPFGEIRAECLVVYVVPNDKAALYGRLPGCGLRFIFFSGNDKEKYFDFLNTLRRKS